ncbi:MAG: transposase [Actinomycetota bacterium]|nr:transposase [Actinomycetota bacterium]
MASNTVNIVRKKRLRIRNEAVWPHDFEWDPSGTKFALEAATLVGSGQQAKGLHRIWIMNVDGSGLRTLRTGWSYDPQFGKFPHARLSLAQWEQAANTLRWETQ